MTTDTDLGVGPHLSFLPSLPHIGPFLSSNLKNFMEPQTHMGEQGMWSTNPDPHDSSTGSLSLSLPTPTPASAWASPGEFRVWAEGEPTFALPNNHRVALSTPLGLRSHVTS